MKRSLFIVSIILLLTLVVGCAPAATSAFPEEVGQSRDFGAPEAPAMEMPAAAPAPSEDSFSSGGNSAAQVERLVIENADLTIVVDEPAQGMASIAKLASDMGGFVVTSNLYKTRTESGLEVPQANITIRVPVEKLNEALDNIKGLTRNPEEDVRSENRSGQDVTKEYTDLQSRLRNLEDMEVQLREIMASATKTEDVVNVFNQLSSVREQIEVIKGQIKYYEESAALSAVSVQLWATEAVDPLTIGSWKPEGVARDAVQALINALKFLANLAIWLVLFLLPVALLIGVPLFFIVRTVRRRRKAAPPVLPKE